MARPLHMFDILKASRAYSFTAAELLMDTELLGNVWLVAF